MYDEETGFYYLRARYYDPSIGRFLNEDTFEGQIDNPLRYRDPTAHMTDAQAGLPGTTGAGNSIEIQAILPTFLLILGGEKMLLNYYKSLPDYMSTIQLKELFEEFLFSISSRTIDVEMALESLIELSDRQWHTYELLDS
ncbi:RHS repeat-associated core domain-containing protein [Paenibacillus sp. NPDC057934]|uniref:RHS repeat-associated core domain-containing protein n=1 Tax=Paenibacillus sp. NPDC057934 TaxID=3346282 RepID=UPI0036DF3DA1